ncbi:MAG: hypothetical protein IPO21_07650 [Bacteroidales bacterium]|nr:hypothetical protein [Bacteroidales bacterium]
MRNLLLSIIVFLGISAYAQDWKSNKLVSNPSYGSSAYSVEVADVRNSGLNSVFVSTSSGGVYEWVWNSTSKTWAYNTLITGFTGHITLHAGDGRNDETTRLYIVEWNLSGRILEASYTSGKWVIDTIATHDNNTGVFIGDCRGAGINRLYVCTLAGVYEYTYNGVDWNKSAISTQTSAAGPGYIGDALNNGTNKYVSPGEEVTMFSWNNTKFDNTTFEYTIS